MHHYFNHKITKKNR